MIIAHSLSLGRLCCHIARSYIFTAFTLVNHINVRGFTLGYLCTLRDGFLRHLEKWHLSVCLSKYSGTASSATLRRPHVGVHEKYYNIIYSIDLLIYPIIYRLDK